jgi:Domain of unknown function (DUF4209)
MTFPLTATEIDAVAQKADKPFDYLLSSAFWREANTQGLPPEKAEAYRLVGMVLGLPFHPRDPAHPFGDPRTSPAFESLTVERAAELECLAPGIQTAQIRARLADVAWTRKRGTAETARLAVAAYLASARSLEDPQSWTECAKRIERAARLSRSLGVNDPSFPAVSAYLVELVDRYRGNDPLFLTGKAVELLLEFNIGDPDVYVGPVERAATLAREGGNFRLERFYLDLLAKLHARRKDDKARNDALREFARTFEREAEQRETRGEHLAAVHFYNQAIQAHRRVPNSAGIVDALRPRLQQAERASVANFKKLSVPIDFGERALLARQRIAGHPTRDAILRLAHISPIPSFERIKDTITRAAEVAPIQHYLLGGAAVDSQGRRVGLRPAFPLGDADQEEAMFARAVEHMHYQRLFDVEGAIIPALGQLASEHAITLQEMEGLAAFSPFVPPARTRIFAEGLHAGFNYDFLTAVHLLVPQIENSLRHLMQQHNIITTKLDKDGIQREIDLNDLLIDPRVATIVSENILFTLRCLLTDNRGPNLRNRLAHGLLEDGAFSSVEAVYAWWIVLSLCFSPAVTGAVPEQSETAEPQPPS